MPKRVIDEVEVVEEEEEWDEVEVIKRRRTENGREDTAWQPGLFRRDQLPSVDGDGVAVLLTGKRRTGKTTWIKWLMETRRFARQYRYGFVISETARFNKSFSGYVAESDIKNEYSNKLIENIFKFQEDNDCPPAFVIMDDVSTSLRGPIVGEFLVKMYTQGRHLNLDVFCVSHRYKQLAPLVRENSDLIVAFFTLNTESIKSLYEENAASSMTRKEFNSIYRRATKNKGALCIRVDRNDADPSVLLKETRAQVIQKPFPFVVNPFPAKKKRQMQHAAVSSGMHQRVAPPEPEVKDSSKPWWKFW